MSSVLIIHTSPVGVIDTGLVTLTFAGKKKQASRGDKLKELDWAVGELLRTLETLGMGADTLVYFTSTSHRAAPGKFNLWSVIMTWERQGLCGRR